MAKNQVAGDDTFQCAAPGGGVVTGLVYKFNKLCGVALATAAAGEQVAFAIKGAFRVVCAGEVMAVGQMLYVSGTGVTAVPNAYPAGVCLEVNAGAATSTVVLLNRGVVDAELDLTVVLPGTLEVTGNTSVNTDKFKVIATSGNTTIAGTLGVTGDTKINTDKVVITASSGNTAIAGTLVNTGKITANGGIAMETASAAETGAAITQSKHSGKITTVSLTTAAAASYAMTLTNTRVAATSIVLASVGNGTNTQGEPVLGACTVTANTVVFNICNRHASQALNGTLEIMYAVINPA